MESKLKEAYCYGMCRDLGDKYCWKITDYHKAICKELKRFLTMNNNRKEDLKINFCLSFCEEKKPEDCDVKFVCEYYCNLSFFLEDKERKI